MTNRQDIMDIALIKKTLMKLKNDYWDGNAKRIEGYISETKKRTNEDRIGLFLDIGSLLVSEAKRDEAERMAYMALEELQKYFYYEDKIYLDYALLNLVEYVIITERRKEEGEANQCVK